MVYALGVALLWPHSKKSLVHILGKASHSKSFMVGQHGSGIHIADNDFRIFNRKQNNKIFIISSWLKRITLGYWVMCGGSDKLQNKQSIIVCCEWERKQV